MISDLSACDMDEGMQVKTIMIYTYISSLPTSIMAFQFRAFSRVRSQMSTVLNATIVALRSSC